jgi:predicted sugar kinase
MKTGLQLSVAALALAGTSLFTSVPASADSYGYGPSAGIGFSYETGGYCDSAGCPEDFWDYPIAYCPV